jgi:hypothetical protein
MPLNSSPGWNKISPLWKVCRASMAASTCFSSFSFKPMVKQIGKMAQVRQLDDFVSGMLISLT